jgi:hypothetical protein
MGRGTAWTGIKLFLACAALLLILSATGHDFGYGRMSLRIVGWNSLFVALEGIEVFRQRRLENAVFDSDGGAYAAVGDVSTAEAQAAGSLIYGMGLLLLYLAVGATIYEIAFSPREALIHIVFAIVGADVCFVTGRPKRPAKAQ